MSTTRLRGGLSAVTAASHRATVLSVRWAVVAVVTCVGAVSAAGPGPACSVPELDLQFACRDATFGTAAAAFDGPLVLANPLDFCQPVGDGSVRGKIVFSVRGVCPFFQKAEAAAKSGAAGLIIADSTEGELMTLIGGPTDGSRLAIPVVSMLQQDGMRLIEAAKGRGDGAALSARIHFGTAAADTVAGTESETETETTAAQQLAIFSAGDKVTARFKASAQVR
jgi:hypothetical protein